MQHSWLQTNSSFKARMIGKLLGDGCITKQKRRKPRFQFIHMASDYDDSLFCYQGLKKYIPLNAPKYRSIVDSRLKSGVNTQSRTSPVITYLRSTWYLS